MATEFRKGSMGAADQKSSKTFLIVAGGVYLLILLVLFVFNTDLHKFALRAGAILNILGFIMIVASYGVLYMAAKKETGKAGYIAAIAILLILGICTACGFNFDYFGIE